MNDQSFNNNFFTEENSPVPLIPPDQAWEAMQVKLNSLTPGKKRRRTFLWLPPIGCVLLLLLLLGGGYGIWRYTTQQASQANTDKPTKQLTTPLAAKSKEARLQGSTINDTLSQDRPAVLSNNDTSSLSRNTGAEEKVLLTSKTTQPIQPAQRRSSGMRSTGLRQEPKLPEETVGPASVAPANFLRPSTVAGLHYQASILVLPYKAPKPVWLPEDHSTNGASGKPPARKTVWAAGLQVEVPVPVSSVDVYFKNPDAKDRFYQPLSPGIWGSITRNRHRITGEFKPFASALLPNKTFQKHMLILPDGTALPGDKKLVKVFGTQAGLQYTFQVNKHWWVGAGVDISMWRKALILSEGLDSMLNMSRIRGVHKNDAPYLNAFQPGGVLHLAYESRVWTGMLQIGSPFKPTVAVQGFSVPVWARLGIRLRLLQSKNAPVGGPLDQVRCP